MKTYQEVYPSEPLMRSGDMVRQRASDLLSLEYFEADPDEMPTQAFDQHHILISLKEEPHRVENWRGGEHHDFIFHQNEIVVTPAGLESGWRWHERSKCIVITLDPAKLEAFTQNELGVLLTDRQLRDLPQFEDEDITSAAVMLLDALRLPGHGSDLMFESLARVFLVKLVQKYGDERSADIAFSRAFTAAHYKRVLDFVADNYGTAIQIEDMAREAGLSASHFSRLFKQTVGDTPYQFLTRYRVEQASELLSDPSRAMIDIALACGFSDQPHFTRVFKQIRGETPRRWRAKAERT
ncbi:MAG: AraC family transcriptional regulator [Pseudomonadota bacterium]